MASFNLYNLPRVATLEDYHLEIDRYINAVKNISGVRSIFTMGSIKAPGLSDIDIIIVVEDNFSLDNSIHLSTANFDTNFFIHGPVVVPKALLSNFQYLIYATGLKRVYGEDTIQGINDIHIKKLEILEIAYLIDFQESRIKQYYEAFNEKKLDVRAWIPRLWSLSHSLYISKKYNLEIEEECLDTICRIENIRNNWIKNNTVSEDEFLDVFLKSIDVSREFIKIGLNKLYGNYDVSYFDNKELKVGGKKVKFIKNGLNMPYIIKKFALCGRSLSICEAFLEPSHGLHFSLYGFMKGSPKELLFDSDIGAVLKNRTEVTRMHWDWLKDHCRFSQSMTGYLGVRPFQNYDGKSYLKNLVETSLMILN